MLNSVNEYKTIFPGKARKTLELFKKFLPIMEFSINLF